jgi:diacylglycerol kinase (ATP)
LNESISAFVEDAQADTVVKFGPRKLFLMLICPEAKPDDGLLDILMVRPLSRFDFIRIYPKVFKGTHVTDPRVIIRQGKKFRLESPNLIGYSDGERIGALPMDVEVRPLSLSVLDTRLP